MKPTIFSCLFRRRAIAVADGDNLWVSTKQQLGATLDPGALHRYLAEPTLKLTASSILTTHSGMTFTTNAWRKGGWNVTPIVRETVQTIRGKESLANADFEICCEAASLVMANPYADALILCTGDGNLATAIARDAKRRRPDMLVVAVAVHGSASSRLRIRSIFDAFIPLGKEVTKGHSSALCA